MSAPAARQQRRRLGKFATVVSREFVYETADGIEIESRDQYDVARKKVLYEEVLLVTFHREMGAIFLIVALHGICRSRLMLQRDQITRCGVLPVAFSP